MSNQYRKSKGVEDKIQEVRVMTYFTFYGDIPWWWKEVIIDEIFEAGS